jgi:hypothetical protein
MTEHLAMWRTRARWFAAEFLVIVTGVLVAVALNSVYQRRYDMRSEATYLVLLNRDVTQTTLQLEEKVTFEAAQLRDGVAAYRALSGTVAAGDRARVSGELSNLIDRRTMILQDATYQDLLSTGNLRLIRNRGLRDQIVAYYGTTRGDYEIMNKNNAVFVDELYNALMIGQGLVYTGKGGGNLDVLTDLNAKLSPLLRDGYIEEPDRLWSLPAGAPEWVQVKSALLARVRAAALSEQAAQRALVRTRALGTALAAERHE